MALLASPGVMPAAEKQSGSPQFASSPRTPKDLEIETKVRRALRQDAQLRPLNLGVHLRGGIAQVSGPVPAAELKQRAIAIVRRVEGVRQVNAKELYVSTVDQSGQRLSIFISEDRPTQTRSASPGSLVDASVGTGRQITLLAPEMTASAARAPQAGRLTAHPHPASSTVSVAAAIEKLRQREARYQQLRTRVQGTTVYIFPGETANEDAMTFAQAVRRLPGVQHVVLSSGPR